MAAGRNEAAVELEVLYPLLTQPGQLAIPADAVEPKQYLPPTQLDKVGGRTSGYFPDFSVWLVGYPVGSYRQFLVTARPVRRRRLWADGQSVWR